MWRKAYCNMEEKLYWMPRTTQPLSSEFIVSRPALSASRSSDIIDFLASFPEQEFTLSEIMRATKINVASCHAVLATLTDCGYITRCPKQRTYTLGPALVAIGQSALKSQPLIARAKEASENLLRELGAPVLLSAAISDEILGILALPDAAGRFPGMRVGERKPLVAPLGAPFLAWSSEEAIEGWIARHQGPIDESLAAAWRHSLALIRQRGFQVMLRGPDSPQMATLMSQMAAGHRLPDYKDEMARLVNSFDAQLSQPETIEPDEVYDVMLISTPLFDQNGRAVFNMSVGGFAKKITGAVILNHADHLVRTCLEIMHADREQPARRDRETATVGLTPEK